MNIVPAAKIEKMRPDFGASQPLYVQIADRLRDLIIKGEVSVGDTLPSERSLQDLTGTSRVTIRKAISQLVSEGFLLSRRGVGTSIAAHIEQSGERLTGFTSDAVDRGEKPGTFWLHKVAAKPTSHEAQMLEIASNELVLRLGRVRLANKEPLAIEHAVVPADLVDGLHAIESSLYDALGVAGNAPITGTQKIGASDATAIEAGLLAISEGDSVLRIERHTYRADGRAVEYTRSVYRADRYLFVSELRREPKRTPLSD